MPARPVRSRGLVVLSRIALILMWLAGLTACNAAPPSHVEAGRDALKASDTPKAITELEKAVADEPGSAEAHILLGQAYVRADRKDEAQAQFAAGFNLDVKASLSPDSQNPEEHFLAGNAYATLGRFDQALAEYQTVLTLAPDKAGARFTSSASAALKDFSASLRFCC